MSYSNAALNGFGDSYNSAALNGFGDSYNSAALDGFGESYNSAALDGFGCDCGSSYNSAAVAGFGRPKLKKGSAQAKAYMAYLRSLRTGKRRTTSTKKLKGKGLGKIAMLGILGALLAKKFKKGGMINPYPPFKLPPYNKPLKKIHPDWMIPERPKLENNVVYRKPWEDPNIKSFIEAKRIKDEYERIF